MVARYLSLLAVLIVASPLVAAPPTILDPETAKPYEWRIVVRFDPHPMLPAQFRALVLADIRAALQPPLGELGRLDISELPATFDDKSDPLLKRFAEKGWPALEGIEFRKLTGVKTHLLRVSFANGLYRLESRQHDGSTGLVSPVVRKTETDTPATVGRHAGMMIARDFGPVGTIEKIPNEPNSVKVRFRGGAIGGLDRYVKPGDVFAVAVIQEQALRVAPPKDWRNKQVVEEPKIQLGQPREFTLLQAEGPLVNGECKCRLLTKFANPLPMVRGVIGFRCLKLATVEGAVQVKVVDDRSGVPLPASSLVKVRANDTGFNALAPARDAFELRDGLFRSTRPLRNVACIVVGLGTSKEVQYPVPVLGTNYQHVLRFESNDDDAVRARFEQECEDLRGRVAQARYTHAELVKALTRLIVKGENREAHERATAGLANMIAADQELTTELNRLRLLPAAKDPRLAELLASAEANLQAVRTGKTGIEERVGQLKAVIAKANDPVKFEREFRAKELASRITQLVETGEIPEAIDLYDQLFEVTQQPEHKDQKTKLIAEWEPRNDEHRNARDFVTGKWRMAKDLTEYTQQLEPLKDAVSVMVKNDDRLGLRNVLSSMEPAYAKLKEILDVLDQNSETDRASVKAVQDVTTALRKLEDEARTALKKIESAPKGNAP